MTLPNYSSVNDPGQPGGELPAYGVQPPDPMVSGGKNTMAVIALVLAIIGLVAFLVPVATTIMLIAAIIISIIALLKAKNYPKPADYKGMSIAALIIAAFALCLNLVITSLVLYLVALAPECIDMPDAEAWQQCVEQKANS